MNQVGKVQLILLKIFYISLGFGFLFLATSNIFDSKGTIGNLADIGKSVLAAMAFLCLIGFFRPLKTLLLLLFSVVWKSIWLIVFVIPAYLGGNLDEFTKNIFLPVSIGLIITAAVIPWKYMANIYLAPQAKY